MANKIKLTIQVNDDGSLGIIGKKAKEAAGATDQLDKSTKKLNKSQKTSYRSMQGAAHTSSGLGKNFAKQAQGISGGLVPAYAALAANIFAVTAAFGALSRAAQVEQLQAGITALGTNSGIAMNTLSRGLQQATGNALNLEEAMRATALTISGGFGADTLQRLGDVARNASIALGRDTTDALNRLVKGATKLEPELLDELGIMVRLDEASAEYAGSLGKTANQLTLTEKRQAFMNAVLEEGESKFKAIGDAVDTNPYDKLAASFSDLSKTILSGLNTVLIPVVNLLTESTLALVGTLTLFGSSVLKSMAPSITDISTRYGELASAQSATGTAALSFLSNLDGVPPKFRELQDGLEDATDKTERFKGMTNSLNASVKRNESLIEGADKATKKGADQVAASTVRLQNNALARKGLADAILQEEKALVLLDEAQAAGLISQGKFKLGFEKMPGIIDKITENYKKQSIGVGLLAKANLFLGASFAKLAVRLRLFGLAFVTMLPLIGGVVIALGALVAAGIGIRKLIYHTQGLTEEVKALNEATKAANALNKENADIMNELALARKGFSDSISTQTQLSIASGNAISTQTQSINKQLKLINSATADTEAYRSAVRLLVRQIDTLTSANPELRKQVEIQRRQAGVVVKARHGVRDYTKTFQENERIYKEFILDTLRAEIAQKELADALKNAKRPLNDFYNSLSVQTPYDNAVAGINEVTRALEQMGAMTGDNQKIQAALRLIAEGATKGLGAGFSEDLQEELKGVADRGLGGTLVTRGQRKAQTAQDAKTFAQAKEEIRLEEEFLEAQQRRFQVGKADQAIAATRIKSSQAQQLTEAQASYLFERQNDLKREQIAENESLLAAARRAVEAGKNVKANEATIRKLLHEQNTLRGELLFSHDEEVMIAQNSVALIGEQQKGTKQLLKLQNQINQARQTGIDLQEQTAVALAKAASRQAGFGRELKPDQELKIAEDLREERVSMAKEELRIKKATIDMEFTLLRAQLKLLEKQAIQTNFENRQSIAKARNIHVSQVQVDDIIPVNDITAAITASYQAQTAAAKAAGNVYQSTILRIDEDIKDKRLQSAEYLASRDQKHALTKLEAEQSGQKALNDIVQQTIDSENALLDAKRETLEANARTQSLNNPAIKEEKITAAQRADIEEKLQADRIAIVMKEKDLKIAMINMEMDLLKARLEVSKAEAAFRLKELGFTDDEIKNVTGQFDSALATVKEARGTAIGAVAFQASNQIVGIIQDVASTARAKVDEATGASRGPEGNLTSPNAGFDLALQGAAEELKREDANITEKTAALSKAGLKLQETLNSFGTENPAMTAALGAAVTISNAWEGAFDDIDMKAGMSKDNIVAGLGAVSATIGAMAQVQKASSDQRISAIDSEIDAEKKRDGKSKESLAKIASLEKKKQAEKRKAFEQNKKMQIAQTVIATAQAAMSAYSSLVGIPVVGPALAAAAAAAAIALGMKQVQMIQSQTMDGGGAGGMSGPTAVSVGQRGSGIDIAKSQSARGELGYMRGDRGTGGPENFKPAFAGARYRAAGGETAGYVVGEQGPELFVPNAPGTIVPNDDMPTGTPINATFNINTIDASGVEDILVSQRGNIIGMIREGANSYGKGFLEEVDTSIYTPSAGGVSRY